MCKAHPWSQTLNDFTRHICLVFGRHDSFVDAVIVIIIIFDKRLAIFFYGFVDVADWICGLI